MGPSYINTETVTTGILLIYHILNTILPLLFGLLCTGANSVVTTG